MFDKLVVKNTYITVERILGKLGGEMQTKEMMADHPHFIPDILAAHKLPANYSATDEPAFG